MIEIKSKRKIELRPVLLFFILLIFSCPLSYAQDDRPTFKATVTSNDIKIDGVLDESDWQSAGELTNFKTTVPVQGGDPSGATVVKVLANEKYIAFGIRCFDQDPSGIVSFSKLRDTDLSSEDYIKIVIDPFLDGQSGYIFSINPSAARYDALVANRGESENRDWDGIWEAEAKIDDQGWTAEIKIPIQTINFRPGLKQWGFNVERNIQRNIEIIRWANVRRDQWFTQTSRAGLLTGLPRFNYGIGINVRPSIIMRMNDNANGQTDYDLEPALTLSQRIGANITATATFNTDFAETEVDTRQTNLTRFPLFFPEKRAFFLEGADIFEFGFGLSRDIIPFFSRRIGLLNGNQIPINAGLKLNGRHNRASFGGVLMRTGSETIPSEPTAQLIPSSTMGVFRIKQNVLKESSFGFYGAFGDPQGRAGASTVGADFTYQTTKFGGNKNFLVGTWYLNNQRDGLEGDNAAYGIKVDYPNDIWDVAFTYTHIGDAFNPSLGFVPRIGVNKINLGGTWGPRPKWKLVRQIRNQIFFTYFTDLDWEWQTYRVFTAPLNWRFESGERFEFNIVPQGERLIEPFGISEGVTIPVGEYNFTRYRLEGDIAAKRKLNGRLTWWFGPFYDGRLKEYQARINWNPSKIITFEFSMTRNIARLPSGNFDQSLLGARIRFNATPNLQLNSFFQYDTDSKQLGLNSRIHWVFHPQGDFFVVFNNAATYLSSMDRFLRDNSQLLIKLRYNFRF